jgi:hypothetical protein
MNARRSRRRTSHNARAGHARTRAREPAERITDALDRLELRYKEAEQGDDGTLAVLAAAYDWLRALIKLAGREVDPERDGWAEDNHASTAVFAVARVARRLADEIRDEAKNL